MKIIFRADGNSNTGLGHLFRIFALLEMLKEHFICIILTQKSSTLKVIPEEYNLITIPEDIKINEEPEWLKINYPNSEYVIIADGYQFTSNYQSKLKKIGYKFAYVDDFAKEKMFADLVINHSIQVKKTDFIAQPKTHFALGTEHAMLRPLFLEAAKKPKEFKTTGNLFICFGGADFFDITNTSLKGVLSLESIKKIHVVLGQAYKHKEIFKTIKSTNKKITIHKNLTEFEMVNLMKTCDLAIIPSSTISYEICCIKMLVLGGFYIDNQKMIYNGLKQNKLIEPLGDLNKLTAFDFEKKTKELLNKSNTYHQEMINNQHKYFDGKQKERFLNLTKEILC